MALEGTRWQTANEGRIESKTQKVPAKVFRGAGPKAWHKRT